MSTKKTNKKGISPLIATVIIIGFTIVLAAGLIYWGTGFFKNLQDNASKGASINTICAGDLAGLEAVATVAASGDLSLVLDNTKDNVNVYGFVLSYKNAAGLQQAKLYEGNGPGVLSAPVSSFTRNGKLLVGPYSLTPTLTVTKANLLPGGTTSAAVGDSVTIKPVVKVDPNDKNEVPSVCGNEIATTVSA